jgi:hypothetical protein
MSIAVELVIFTKANGPLTKRITLNPDGTLHSDGSSCVMASGEARRVLLDGVSDLALLIDQVRSDQALGLGRLAPSLPDHVSVVAKRHLGTRPAQIARTRTYLVYADGQPAAMLFDHDAKSMPQAVRETVREAGGFLAALALVVPGLRDGIGLVSRLSTSAGLSRSDTDERFDDSGGRHVYVIVLDGVDIERALRALHDRCWLEDLAWLEVGRAGQLLDRSIIDRMVYGPERFSFEGPPQLEAPLIQDLNARRPRVHEGGPLDTRAAIPSLNPIEQERLKQLKAAAAAALKPAQAKAHAEFLTEQTKRLAALGVPPEQAKTAVERLTAGVLLPAMDLPFDDPQLAGKTVGDVLADPDAYIGETLADPVEGVAYGTGKAMVLARADGTLIIHSYAHGRTIYRLRYDADALRDVLARCADNDVIPMFVRLARRSADLTELDHTRIREEIIERLSIGARDYNRQEKHARAAEAREDRERERERRDAERAAKGDLRPRLPAPAGNAPQLDVMATLDAVLASSDAVEPPMRDGMGWLVAAYTRRPVGLHALGQADADAPEQVLLVRLDNHEVLRAVEQHIDFHDPFGISVRLRAVFVREYRRQRLGSPLPAVGSVATMPIVMEDGAVLSGHQLDRERGVLFRVPASLDSVLPKPSECDSKAVAVATAFLVNEWLVDVQAGYATRLKLIAMACTLIERHVLKVRPGFMVTSSQRGDGKTTAVNMVSLATVGAEAPGATWANDEDERRKALLAYLSQGIPLLPYDNLRLGASIDCPHIARVLTSGTYADRVLGETETREVDTTTVISWTGNNVACIGDLASRVLRLPFTSTRVDPENRSLTHSDPLGWTRAHRAQILRAFYTVILGNPRLHGATIGDAPTRFKDWWRIVGVAIEWAAHCHIGHPELWRDDCQPCVIAFEAEFASNEADNEQTTALAIVLDLLRRQWPDTFTAAEVIKYAFNTYGDIQAADFARDFFPALDTATHRAPLQHWTAMLLGLRLKKLVGTPVMLNGATMALCSFPDDGRRGAHWAVREIVP